MKKRKGLNIKRKVFAYPYVLFMLVFVLLPLILMLQKAFVNENGLTLEYFEEFSLSRRM